MKKKRGKKHLIVQIEAIDVGNGEYFLYTTQLSNLNVPLTQFEIESSKSAGKNPMPKHELKKAIGFPEESEKFCTLEKISFEKSLLVGALKKRRDRVGE